jgi:hypothetical protein
MSHRNLYALLVGINDYPIDAHRLFGCHNDVQAAKEFLENRTNRSDFNLNVKTLLSKEATRSNIAKGFEEHLGQAGENDVVLFYYSGHGSQEKAGDFFSHLEPDGMNETLVCWDSRIEDGMDLADKELATLIQLVSQRNPHIVVLLDCCHSGSGSRAVGDPGQMQDYLVRQSPTDDRLRPLDSYILPRNLDTDRSVMRTKGMNSLVIPDGRHVALSAAESFQLAKETTLGGSRRGVFSYSLIELLQNATGDFTYDDLMRRSRSLVARRTFEQTPTIFATHTADLNTNFLDGSTGGGSDYFALTFDRDHGWLLDGGTVHGIIKGEWGEDTTVLAAFPDHLTDLDDLSQAVGRVEVTDVAPNRSIVRLASGSGELDKSAGYKCRIVSLPVEPNLIYLHGQEAGLSDLRKIMAAEGGDNSYLREIRDLGQADYKLLAVRDRYIISRAADGMGDAQIIQQDGMDYRPLVAQIAGYSEENANQVVKNLIHIAKWERSLELNNPASKIPTAALKMEVWDPIEDKKLPMTTSGYHFTYDHNLNPEGVPFFRLKIVNQGSKKLYFSLLFYSSQFQIFPYMLEEGGQWLEPGESAWAMGGDPIPGFISDNLKAFGVTKTVEHLKLIASTERFHPEMLEMNELGEPQAAMRSADTEFSVLDGLLGGTTSRSLKLRVKTSGTLHDWNTNELSLSITRKN